MRADPEVMNYAICEVRDRVYLKFVGPDADEDMMHLHHVLLHYGVSNSGQAHLDSDSYPEYTGEYWQAAELIWEVKK